MPLEFTCPACSKPLTAPLAAAGQAGNCKYCRARLIAPAASGRPASMIIETAPSEPVPAAVGSAAPDPGPSAFAGPGYPDLDGSASGGPRTIPPDIRDNPAAAGAFVSIGTPPISDFYKRGLGFGLDFILIVALELGLRALYGSVGIEVRDFWMARQGEAGAVALVVFSLFSARVLYGAVFESSALQATPGKWILGMRVCTEQGAPIRFPQALWRNYCKWALVSVASFVPWAGSFPFFVFIWAMRDELTQTWHDMLASTVVAERE